MKDQTIHYLRHALADQLAHSVRLQVELDQAVDTINGLLELVEVMTTHINVFHAQHGMPPMVNEFAGLEYVAFAGEAA
ncbi:hypothetical protein ACIGFL_08825 [Pseudomonas sp. NPDC077649]|uniref:hypothetical protein n=1 Tax=Pseudomonas sp. NPDC077649 TaxID=3364423 RepID=UPI0037CB649D